MKTLFNKRSNTIYLSNFQNGYNIYTPNWQNTSFIRYTFGKQKNKEYNKQNQTKSSMKKPSYIEINIKILINNYVYMVSDLEEIPMR